MRVWTLGFALVLWVAGSVHGQEGTAPAAEEQPPVLSIASVVVEPERPAAETLCTLRVTLENSGSDVATALRFEVAVAGVPLEVYAHHLFMPAVRPRASLELPLYNFWSSETGRPLPKGAALDVTVRLVEARAVTIETAEDGEEVWTLGEAIAGLPVERTASVPLAKPAGGSPR